MSATNDKDLKNTQELYDFLRGKIPDGTIIRNGHRPKLTDDQAWAVIWYLGNQYWQVTDRVEKCEVCGDLYHSWQEGGCLDFGKSPYFFCDNCLNSEEYVHKAKSRLNPNKEERRDLLVVKG